MIGWHMRLKLSILFCKSFLSVCINIHLINLVSDFMQETELSIDQILAVTRWKNVRENLNRIQCYFLGSRFTTKFDISWN